MDILQALSEGAFTAKELQSKGVTKKQIEDAELERKVIIRDGVALEKQYNLRCLPYGFNGRTKIYALREQQYEEWIAKNKLVRGGSIRGFYY